MDLLAAPDQMILQIHESIGHPLELDRIIGDERGPVARRDLSPQDALQDSIEMGQSAQGDVPRLDPQQIGSLIVFRAERDEDGGLV